MSDKSPKRIIIFTTFSDISAAYSLNRVVEDQLKMFLTHGYNPLLIVAESFVPKGIYEKVELLKIPNVPVHNEVKKDETFDRDVEEIYQALKTSLQPGDVVLTHDIIYQSAALKHNFAARKIAQEMPDVKWMHWIHSATSPITLINLRPIFGDQYLDVVTMPFPNSFYIFFNHYSIPRIARNFGVDENVVRVIHHPSDLQEVFGMTDAAYQFAREKDLFSGDVICVYPVRLDNGKQVEMVIKTMACLKDFDLKVKLVVVDFHSTGGEKIAYRDFCKQIAIDWGLSEDELIWTSEYKPEWNVEIPHDDVMSLMRLVNVFIMPSVSESYSLITQEAGLNKAIMVLNFDFPPFRDIFGPAAIYRKYHSNIDTQTGMDGNTDVTYNDERAYHTETAGMIVGKLNSYIDQSMAARLRKYRGLDYIFKHEMEPLLFEEVK